VVDRHHIDDHRTICGQGVHAGTVLRSQGQVEHLMSVETHLNNKAKCTVVDQRKHLHHMLEPIAKLHKTLEGKSKKNIHANWPKQSCTHNTVKMISRINCSYVAKFIQISVYCVAKKITFGVSQLSGCGNCSKTVLLACRSEHCSLWCRDQRKIIKCCTESKENRIFSYTQTTKYLAMSESGSGSPLFVIKKPNRENLTWRASRITPVTLSTLK